MKLTNFIRDAFIRSALADVPQIDYEEKIRALLIKDAIAQLPVELRKAYLNPATIGYINIGYSFTGAGSTSIPCNNNAKDFKLSTAAQQTIDALKVKCKEQEIIMWNLRDKIKAAAYAVTTSKLLLELLPEFDKYLPVDITVTKNLPAIQGILTDFIKAGWPKDKPKMPKIK